MNMNFNLENRDNFAIFTVLDNSIEGKIAADLKARILVVAQPDVDALVIDLSSVKVIDSSGLGALLLAHRQLKDHSIPVVLVGMQDFTRNLLKITRIEDIFEYYDNVDAALSGIKEKNSEAGN
jgi:anti-anti-sigma factor